MEEREERSHKLRKFPRKQRGVPQHGEYEGVVICFRCSQEGHHKSDCKNLPLCYNCKECGHMSQNCPRVKTKKGLQLCGFGLLGQMFYNIHVPVEEDQEEQKSIMVVMHIRDGVGPVSKVTNELRYLINSKWDWQVRKIANGKYEFVVPSKGDLNFLTKFTEFQCKVSVEKASLTDGSFDQLTSVWVKMSGVP